jgi:dTDP-glucose 4,6-dehydratase
MNLAWHLCQRGESVLSISRSPLRSAPFTYGLEHDDRFCYEQAHLVTELPRIMALLDDFQPDVIVNFAALCEVGLSWNHALDYYETNLMSLVRLTDELAKRSWFKKFVQIGSSEVYGSVETPATEHSAYRPSSPYAASKAVFDFHLRAICAHQAFPGLIVMPSNGYCEGQTLNRIIPKAIIAALTGTKLQLQGGGVAQKSYLHADDISSAIILCAEKGTLGETYNVGPEGPLAIKTIVNLVAAMLGTRMEDVADVAPERVGQDSCYWLDSTKIKELGWKQTIGLAEGLTRMAKWINAYPELLTMDTSYTHKP